MRTAPHPNTCPLCFKGCRWWEGQRAFQTAICANSSPGRWSSAEVTRSSPGPICLDLGRGSGWSAGVLANWLESQPHSNGPGQKSCYPRGENEVTPIPAQWRCGGVWGRLRSSHSLPSFPFSPQPLLNLPLLRLSSPLPSPSRTWLCSPGRSGVWLSRSMALNYNGLATTSAMLRYLWVDCAPCGQRGKMLPPVIFRQPTA